MSGRYLLLFVSVLITVEMMLAPERSVDSAMRAGATRRGTLPRVLVGQLLKPLLVAPLVPAIALPWAAWDGLERAIAIVVGTSGVIGLATLIHHARPLTTGTV